MRPSRPARFPSAPRVLLGALALFFVWTGARGLDFGAHWDEDKLVAGAVHALENKTLLPGSYLYPSLFHEIALATVVVARGPGGPTPIEMARSPVFLRAMRWESLLFSTMALIFTFLAVVFWGRGEWEGLGAAAVLGLSWELAYHARWFTVDSPTVAFSAATLAALALHHRARARRWLWVAAASAGLAAGAKYTAGLLLLPVLAAAARPDGERWRRGGGATAIFFAVFLITTPGVLLAPTEVVRDVVFQIKTYGVDGNDAYTIARGGPHLLSMAVYAGAVFGSPYRPIAVGLGLLALGGAVDLLRREKNAAVWFGLFPVAHVVFFSLQIVMIARNLLPVMPFFAVLAARGLSTTARSLPPGRAVRVAAVGGLVLWGTLNGAWLWDSATSIQRRSRFDAGAALRAYVLSRSNDRFLFTRAAVDAWGISSVPLPGHVETDPTRPTDFTVFNTAEAKSRWIGRWPANRSGTVVTTFGPREVNLDYYPTWLGDPRLVVMRTDRALRLWEPPRGRS
jgi:hypothetical protein